MVHAGVSVPDLDLLSTEGRRSLEQYRAPQGLLEMSDGLAQHCADPPFGAFLGFLTWAEKQGRSDLS